MEQFISIGMPVYNDEVHIERTIKSILNQTHQNFELIISDNCSTDRTYEICLSFSKRDKRIVLFKQNENIGMMGNFNFVLQKGKSEYFMWVAGDDIHSNNCLENLLNALQNNRNSIVAFSFFDKIDYNGGLIKRYDDNKYFTSGCSEYIRLKKIISLKYYDQTSNIIYGLWRSRKIMNTKMHYLLDFGRAHDYHFVASMLIEGDCSIVQEVNFAKRNHKISQNQYRKVLRNIFKSSNIFFIFIFLYKILSIVFFTKFIIQYLKVIVIDSQCSIKEKFFLILYLFFSLKSIFPSNVNKL